MSILLGSLGCAELMNRVKARAPLLSTLTNDVTRGHVKRPPASLQHLVRGEVVGEDTIVEDEPTWLPPYPSDTYHVKLYDNSD